MRTAIVDVKIRLAVEFPDDFTDEDIRFAVEENSCPAAGAVGEKLTELVNGEAGVCWACPAGENKVLRIE